MSSIGVPLARGEQGRTLRQGVGRVAVALVVVLAALFAVLFYSLSNFRSRGDEVIDRWLPAYGASQNLLADLVNQETGIRGYALGRSETFLEPYRTYLAQESVTERMLDGYVAGHASLVHDLADVRAASERWRARIALPLIAQVRAGEPSARGTSESVAGKAAFDEIRVVSATLTADLAAQSDRAKHDRSSAILLVYLTAIVGAAVVALSAFAVWIGLRRAVLAPVESLAAQTRHVASGALGEPIRAAGPLELAALGRDVETMRARIAAELARVVRARAVLIERGEELARSNADLEQFAYVASHDLSEPLRKVSNFCQLLERQYGPQLDDKARQYIDFAVDGAKRMQMLITDLLAFSRVGRTTDSFVEVDLNRALTRALATLDDRIVAAAATITCDDLPTVPGDATLLTALMQNLVGNALKYADPERAPRVEIGAQRDGEVWRLSVRDNGIGIDQQYAERIFTIFQRLHLRDKYGGTGIGLALCRKIVEFHRGRIWLCENDPESDLDPELGATFVFTLAADLAVSIDSPDPMVANEY